MLDNKKFLTEDFYNVLKNFKTPSKYIGSEIGSVRKDEKDVDLNVCFAFPSQYEIGMSFTGFQILYQMVNNVPNFYAQRTYLPDSDFNSYLREKNIPLFSLETRKFVNTFDVIGISLQYELSILGILEILDLSKISLLSKDRKEDEPLITAGGPLCYNPLPYSKIFDVFFLGDAEDTYIDFLQEISRLKKEGKKRQEILKSISKIEGVFVPQFYDGKTRIKRQIAKDFEKCPSLNNPIIPYCDIVHDRLAIEIQRGCTRGCRFCQAGFMYRPAREKSLRRNFEDIQTSIKKTGHDEVSLLSLSTADYSNIINLIKLLKLSLCTHNETTLSFPSTRVDKLDLELLNEVQVSNRKSFTIAPEGGTQRIRNIINKGVNEEQIFKACENAFSLGWKSLKMYFMIGLPFEKDEDVLGIANLAIKLKNQFKGKNITISVSTFVPKPHTPFEVCKQINTEETLRRQELLFSELRKNKIEYRFNKAFTSTLEGLIARGDDNLTDLFLEVYNKYPKEEIAKEFINKEIWEECIKSKNIDLDKYLGERENRKNLCWKIVDTGLNESFLENEYKKAQNEILTKDCKTSTCQGCGICNNLNVKNIIVGKDPEEFKKIKEQILNKEEKQNDEKQFLYRLKFQKIGRFKLLSYFELMKCFIRALRRTDLQISYSRGFTPRVNLSFGLPLPLGIESESELLDIKLTKEVSEIELKVKLNKVLPDELKILNVKNIPLNSPSIQQETKFCIYNIKTKNKKVFKINENWENILIEKKKERKIRQFPLKNYLEILQNSKENLMIKTIFFDNASIKPKEAFLYLTGKNLDEYEVMKQDFENCLSLAENF